MDCNPQLFFLDMQIVCSQDLMNSFFWVWDFFSGNFLSRNVLWFSSNGYQKEIDRVEPKSFFCFEGN